MMVIYRITDLEEKKKMGQRGTPYDPPVHFLKGMELLENIP